METNYQYRRNRDYNKTISTGEHARLRCFSKKILKKRHPHGAYEVVGAIGTGLVDPVGQYAYETENCFYYNPKQSGLRYRTVGYIEVGEGQYFAIMKKSKGLPIFLVALLLLVLIGVFVLLYFTKGAGSLIDSAATDYTPPEHLIAEGAPNSIAIPGYGEIYVEGGTNVAHVALWNPDNNPCYFSYVLKDEDGEVLYESALIPPGKAITEIELSKNIPVGEHKLTMEIKTFALEDRETPLNGGVVECKLIGVEP